MIDRWRDRETQRFRGQRPLCRRIVRNQCKLRANSSLDNGKPSALRLNQRPAITTQEPAITRVAAATDRKAKPRLTPSSETSSSATPTIKIGKLEIPRITPPSNSAPPVFTRLQVLAELDGGQARLQLGERQQILAEPRNIAHHAAGTQVAIARSGNLPEASRRHWHCHCRVFSTSLDQPSQKDSCRQGGSEGQNRSVVDDSLDNFRNIPQPPFGLPGHSRRATGKGSEVSSIPVP